MPTQLELYLEHVDPSHVVIGSRTDGSQVRLPGLRLVTYANFLRALISSLDAGDYAICRCLVDTGSYLSLISEDLWQRFLPGVITPIAFDPSMPSILRTLTIAGGNYPYTLGELTIQLEDRRHTKLNMTIIAKLTHDRGRLPIPMTLGLRGGFFEGRTLSAHTDPSAPFGQRWMLEEP